MDCISNMQYPVCNFCYSYNRLEHIRKMRWEFGSVLPQDVKVNMSEQEVSRTHWPLGNLNEILDMIDGWGIFCENALIWMSLNFADDQSTLVQLMAWCRQATSHYLSQCWPRSLSPYGVTRPQWVNSTLQWYQRSIMVNQIISNLTVWSRVYSG